MQETEGFWCPECGSRFESRDRMDQHMQQTHRGATTGSATGGGTMEGDAGFAGAAEGQFSCWECGARFQSRDDLDEHNRRSHGRMSA